MEVNRLITLKSKIPNLKGKADTIGAISLYLIKKLEGKDIDNNKLRDLSIKINYLAHEIHDEIKSIEKEG
jgi:hypothetical protein